MSAQQNAITQPSYHGNARLTLGIVLGVLTFWLFAQSMVNIVPAIRSDVDIPSSALNFAISLTALLSGCFIVVAGGLADKFGRVRVTYIGFILSIIGCLLVIAAKEEILFSLGRAVQGISAACIMPSTLALMKTYYQDKERQKALSFWSIGSWGGSGLCSLVSGTIATWANWRWIFVLSIVLALIGMLLLKGTPESKSSDKTSHRFDVSGLITFIIALISLNLLITKGSAWGWQSLPTTGSLIIFVLFFWLFVKTERQKKSKGFIDFSLFANRLYSTASFSNFMLNAAGGTLIISSLYVQQGRGFTAFQAGALTLGYLVAVLLSIRVGEKLQQRIGAKKPMMFGALTAGIGIALMSLTFLPNQGYTISVFIGYILFGIGLGIYATPSTDTAVDSAPADKAGVASGIYKMASSLGAAFGLAISGSVYSLLQPYDPAIAATSGLLVNVLLCLISLLSIAVMLPGARDNPQPAL
ncbi:MFS transporter [Enterobacillus tribolii]|uniref:DHA2 family multidrug resistance protein-like MFS transporter n=1 Tax=Enterobacillus tribolii TaxID=1487935 RepID=A0A370Q8C2_9GAMM|nr:MFS transporter [Enterobacillus tribolii]MBW7984604.1 MFS transporter [Enterobacillus tribolii]RDK84595.1 DHA2 family multidrug resistance protein-like MFS transporter [Enterobacillus tribolii]